MQSFACLMYHNVVRDGSLREPSNEWAALSPSILGYFVEERAFAEQIAALKSSVELVTLQQVREFYAVAEVARLPKNPGSLATSATTSKAALLTFDDGWAGTLYLAAPILRAANAEATVFVTTDLIDKPWFLTRSELANLPKELQVGSHTKTHCFLNELPSDQIREELRVSKQVLEEITGHEIDTISIPNGAVDRRVTQIATEVGYRLVFTSEVHSNSRQSGPLEIGRAAVRTNTQTQQILQFAHGEYGRESLRRLVLGLPKAILGPGRYRRLRARLLGEQGGQLEMADLVAGR
jgi:peptidoglycan/xylan/chitin deacetylase (PgdA/CDA1 family)